MTTIRPATVVDMPAVAAIYRHYVLHTVATFDLEPPTASDWSAKLAAADDAGWPFLVITGPEPEADGRVFADPDAPAEPDDPVVGFAAVALWRAKPAYRHTVEDTVYLDPASTGRGLGRQLLADLLTRAAAVGVRQVVAMIADTGSRASVRLHEACGFRTVGWLPAVGFKHDRWVDVTLMQAALPAVSPTRSY